MRVITKLDKFMWSFLCILGPFLKVKEQNLDYFGVAKISKKNGVLQIPNILKGGQ